MSDAGPLLSVQHVTKHFRLRTPLFQPAVYKKAVDNVSFDVLRGQTLALVGESGSGKSTIGLMLLDLLEPTSGTILYDGRPFSARRGRIKTELAVDLPHPRHYTIKTSPEFMDLKARLTEEIRIGEELVSLNSKEFALALLLFENMHRPLSRGYILETLWRADPNLPTRTLDMHVSRIRTKLGLRPENGFRIAAVSGYGYRMERFISGDAH